MDILAHGLWTAVASKAASKSIGKALSVKTAVFWGIFPDIFAFLVPWVLILAGLLHGSVRVADIPGPDSVEPPLLGTFPESIFNLALSLYNISHSFFIFGAAAVAAWIWRKKIPWEMGGWLLHILIDIPTHSYAFFPTPFLWPFSAWKFSHGIPWSEPLFMALNYAALIAACWLLFAKPRLAARKLRLRENLDRA